MEPGFVALVACAPLGLAVSAAGAAAGPLSLVASEAVARALIAARLAEQLCNETDGEEEE